MSTTPVPPSWLLAAQTTVSLILAVIGIGILLGAGAGAFGLALPHDVGGYLVSFVALVLTAAATIGLGLLVASVARTPQIAQALTVFLFYPLAFFSGLVRPDSGDPLAVGLRHFQGAPDRRGLQRRCTLPSAARPPVSSRCSCSSCGQSAHASLPVVSSGGSDEMRSRPVHACLIAALTLLVAACGGSASKPKPSGPPPSASGSWPYPNADLANTRVAPDSTITSENVARLRQAWTFKLSGLGRQRRGRGRRAGDEPDRVARGIVYIQDLDANVYAVVARNRQARVGASVQPAGEKRAGTERGRGRQRGGVLADSAYSVFALNAHTGKDAVGRQPPPGHGPGVVRDPARGRRRRAVPGELAYGPSARWRRAARAGRVKRAAWCGGSTRLPAPPPGVQALGVGAGGAWEPTARRRPTGR